MTTDSTTDGEPVTRRHRKGYFLPGFIALVALLALGLFSTGGGDLQHPAATKLIGSDIASQIGLGIQVEQNSTTAPSVSCPAEEPVRQGLRFTCTMGATPSRTVYVTELDGRGQIRWSLTPSP
jgi:hypothetical protein